MLQEVAAARCVPCLSLRAETLFVEDGSRRGDEVRTAVLRLDFAYGDRRVAAGAGRAARDPAAELGRVSRAREPRRDRAAAPR